MIDLHTGALPGVAVLLFLPRGDVMRNLVAPRAQESGAEVIEYALLLGLLVVGTIVVMGALGVKVVGRWTSLFDVL